MLEMEMLRLQDDLRSERASRVEAEVPRQPPPPSHMADWLVGRLRPTLVRALFVSWRV